MPFKEAEEPVNIIVPLPLSTIPGITFRKIPDNSLLNQCIIGFHMGITIHEK
jgi:hypothetical protein